MTEISFDEWEKIDLRVGKITSAEKIEGADKIYKLQVNLGEKKIQLVAGIAQHYDINGLKGKKICVITNLKPRKLKGVLSEGMLLAAVDEESNKVVLITPDKDIKEGIKIR